MSAATMTTVINLYRAPSGWAKDPQFVYVGRKGRGYDGYFGNPFPLEKGEPRGATIDRFRDYAEKRIAEDAEYRDRVKGLAGKTLVCFCAPAACHGDVLAELADRLALSHPMLRAHSAMDSVEADLISRGIPDFIRDGGGGGE